MATRGCPCGYLSHPVRACRCTPAQVARYQGRVSGPLLDRLDLHVEVPAEAFRPGEDGPPGEASGAIAGRVRVARDRQARRLQARGAHMNAQMTARQVREHCRLDGSSAELLRAATDQFGLSARGVDRALKVARTIADLAGAAALGPSHVAEALQYRALDRNG